MLFSLSGNKQHSKTVDSWIVYKSCTWLLTYIDIAINLLLPFDKVCQKMRGGFYWVDLFTLMAAQRDDLSSFLHWGCSGLVLKEQSEHAAIYGSIYFSRFSMGSLVNQYFLVFFSALCSVCVRKQQIAVHTGSNLYHKMRAHLPSPPMQPHPGSH